MSVYSGQLTYVKMRKRLLIAFASMVAACMSSYVVALAINEDVISEATTPIPN
jgi:Spy/CpxP family protein refolding chaperone